MCFRYTEFEVLGRDPNRDKLWTFEYMVLGSTHRFLNFFIT
jgi:hypothetical protein